MADPAVVTPISESLLRSLEQNPHHYFYSNTASEVLADKMKLRKRGKSPLSKKVIFPTVPYRKMLAAVAAHYGVPVASIKADFDLSAYEDVEYEVDRENERVFELQVLRDSGLKMRLTGESAAPEYRYVTDIADLDMRAISDALKKFLLVSRLRSEQKLRRAGVQWLHDNAAQFLKPKKSLIKFFLSIAKYQKEAKKTMGNPAFWIDILEREDWWEKPERELGMGPRLLAGNVAKRYLEESK